MATTFDNRQPQPFSADPTRITKVRIQSSNCPTILKHEISSPTENFQPFMSSTQSEKQFILDRPTTSNNALKMKLSVLQSIKPMTSPTSTKSLRPLSGMMSSTINFDFLSGIGRAPKGKFQDRSRIKPLKKLKTDQFHNVIYKVKQQKEVLEKDINRMEEWQRDFKENDIWNTPQSAIVESILRMNAKSNPDGSVSKYLQTEKEKEDVLRISKKVQRPMSSYAHFARNTSKAAKSVTDFFKPEDDEEEEIEDIVGSKKNPYHVYENNKRKITDRINNYVDNLENYNTLMHSTKELITSPEARDNPQIRKALDGYLKESRELSVQPEIIESISEIVESNDDLDALPSQSKLPSAQLRPTTAYNRTVQEKSRPYSANMQVHTAFAPKDFTNGAVATQGISPPGMPSAIHTRPQTAKQMKMSPSTPISVGLGALGEPRQESMGSVKFVPLLMAGQRMQVEPYNLTMTKYKDLTLSNKNFNTSHGDGASTLVLRGSKSAKNMQRNINNISNKSVAKEEPSREGERVVSRRLMSAKPGNRSTMGTQTQLPQSTAGLPTVGKLDINGEYFETFMDNPVRAPPRLPPRSRCLWKFSKADKMVLKTELCKFSGQKIYPGKGIRFIRSDSQVFLFANSKCKRYFHNKLKPAKLTWTAIYRKQHKKDIHAETSKKRRRTTKKPYSRSIVGATLEVIQKKRAEKPEVRDAAREAALREIKERIKKTKDEKKAKKAEVTKSQKSQGKGAVQKGSKGPKLGGGGGKR